MTERSAVTEGQAPQIAILAFHSIGSPAPGGWDTWFYIPQLTFARQLQWLRQHDWTVIDLQRLLEGLGRPGTLPGRCALLTFDDAYRSMRTVAQPILSALGYPAVLFVPTDFIGGYNTFEPAGWAPREQLCTWDDLRALHQAGTAIQSHSASHAHLSQLSPAELECEVARSKDVLEAGLGEPVSLFSYPYGDAGIDLETTARALCRTGYRAACLYDGKLAQLDPTCPYRLSRLTMGPDTNLDTILGDIPRSS